MLRFVVMLSAVLLLSRSAVADPPAGKASPSLSPAAMATIAAGKNGTAPPPGATEAIDPTAKLPPELVPAWQISMQFFTDVIQRDDDGATAFSRAPFSFDGHPAATVDEIKKGWARYLGEPSARRPILYSLDVLPYDEMVKRYGAPPAKLSDVSFKGALVAVANIDGRANLAVLRRDPAGLWRVYAFCD